MSYAIAPESDWNILLSQGTGGFGPSAGDPLNPYSNLGGSGMTQPPPRSSNVLWWVLGIGGGVVLLLCCGCGVAGYFLFNVGMSVAGEAVKQQIEDDLVVQEHLGEVQSVNMNFWESQAETEKNRGQKVLVFDVKGVKASGKLIGTPLENGGPGNVLKDMKLRTAAGEFPLSD